MRPWIIAVAGAAVGLVATALWLLLGALPDGGAMPVRAEAPQAALIFFAAYAATVLLLTTASLGFDLAGVRLHLDDAGAPSHRVWAAAFADTGLARLAARLLDFAPADSPASAEGPVLQRRFVPSEARREIACHYRDSLVRAQCATAVAAVVIIAGLGAAQDFAGLALHGFVVPPRLGLTAVAMLIVLAVCARVLVAAATEPLIDAILRWRLPPLELRLFERLSATQPERGGNVSANPQLERLMLALEGGRDTLREAIGRLSANTASVAQAARAIADLQAEAGDNAADAASIAQLHQAIAGLAETIDRLPAAPAPASDEPAGAPGAAAKRRRPARRSDLGSELRRLISEFD